MSFKLYKVHATYKPEYQSETVTGCGMTCYTESTAQEWKERYFYDPKIQDVTVTVQSYGN
jgi:hypothetical protein